MHRLCHRRTVTETYTAIFCASLCATIRGDYGRLARRERIASQPEVIRAVLLEDSLCSQWATIRGDQGHRVNGQSVFAARTSGPGLDQHREGRAEHSAPSTPTHQVNCSGFQLRGMRVIIVISFEAAVVDGRARS